MQIILKYYVEYKYNRLVIIYLKNLVFIFDCLLFMLIKNKG